ncbi:MAG: PrsW family glutamic-type intramembrane protease [Candidatus Peribacteraceae bacterium]|nr:PrsW family glutamic-type intramembrane protease [Candidatus Peribacteraceae bacterium]
MLDALLATGLLPSKTAVVLLAVAIVASLDLMGRAKRRSGHYVFGVLFGTALSVGIMEFLEVLFNRAMTDSPAMMGLGVLLVVVAWRFLFGPWEAHVKATVLGTFLFWIAFQTLFRETPQERAAHVIALLIAAIPAAVWCALFLPYHRERRSVVLLMFFSGMASTAPILFYDALVKRKVELQFFVFRLVPESFNANIQATVRDMGLPSLKATLIALFVSFVMVGILEEGSKYWVLRKNGGSFFSSIDDAMQFAILVAIGFAFAENVTRTGYFFNFVKEFLLSPGKPDWPGFLGNIAGRSILTSMVHIVSTGILGYFVGLAIFADPRLREAERRGKTFVVGGVLRRLLGARPTSVYRTQMVATGFLLAILLHALSNFLVTLPDVLPGNPHTFGELLGAPAGSFTHYVALLLPPALLYVVGGFWLLTMLFSRKENMKERGRVISTEVFVMGE